MTLKDAKHNDIFGDIPPSMDFGDLLLPPGVAKSVSCNRCHFTYTSLDPALNARALAKHHLEEHTLYPNEEEAKRVRPPRK